ncbi:PREDICTED: uncharacterized protein LOC104771631 [Camelina sativa]|uniref:Uncharacterized protein LOC104771631 n=1 Tax=Camelina sativa TaxID=90675 RepID=A0ABM1REQ3_CAMSA|nr:PREDICTED: uncharacterized protein LOC104771631 [Camelina sativa]
METNYRLIVFLLLCIFLCRAESALPSHYVLSHTGRRMMGYYKPSRAIGIMKISKTPPSKSPQAPGRGDWAYDLPLVDDLSGAVQERRLMSQMDVGASSSAQGTGRNH